MQVGVTPFSGPLYYLQPDDLSLGHHVLYASSIIGDDQISRIIDQRRYSLGQSPDGGPQALHPALWDNVWEGLNYGPSWWHPGVPLWTRPRSPWLLSRDEIIRRPLSDALSSAMMVTGLPLASSLAAVVGKPDHRNHPRG